MTLTPLDLRTLCLQMYPDDFRTQALKSTDLDLAPTEDLPLILWRKIQRMRNTDDFTLPVDEMRSILGFNTRTDSDTNNVKNNLLDQILSKTICPSEIHLGHVRDILKDDRHLLKASLYFSPPDEVSLVVDITCPEIARELIAMNWRAYTKLPIHLAIRYDLAMLALKQHLHAYFYIPVQLQQDYRIVHYTISRMDGIYRKLNDELKQDRELIRLAIKRKSINYRWIPGYLKLDAEIVSWLPQDSSGFVLLDATLRRNKQFVIPMLRNDDDIYLLMESEMRLDPDIRAVYHETRTQKVLEHAKVMEKAKKATLVIPPLFSFASLYPDRIDPRTRYPYDIRPI